MNAQHQASLAAIEQSQWVGKQKIIFVGDGGVGKTTFVKRYLTGKFNADAHYVPTLGFEVPLTNKPFEIWDTAGKEKHSGLREYYYLGAKKAVIMFDVRNRNSFDNVLVWLARVKKMCPGITVMLCANKSDSGVDSVVKNSEIAAVANTFGLQWFRASVKDGVNLDKPFSN